MFGLTRTTVLAMAEGILHLGDVVTSPLREPNLIGGLSHNARVYVAIPRIAVDPLWILTASARFSSNLVVVRWHILSPGEQWKLTAGHFFLYDDGGFILSSRTDVLSLQEGQSVRDALLVKREAAREEGWYDWAAESILRLYDIADSPRYNEVPWVPPFLNVVQGNARNVSTIVYGWESVDVVYVPGRGVKPTGNFGQRVEVKGCD